MTSRARSVSGKALAAGKSYSESASVPGWWRWVLLAGATLILCSCNFRGQQRGMAGGPSDMGMPGGPMTLPEASMIPPGVSMGPMMGPISMEPTPIGGCQPCMTGNEGMPCDSSGGACHAGRCPSPDCEGAWPKDEYIFDGGDKRLRASVANDWQVYGLEPEDTIAHYDTVDGRTIVEPSNCVPIYAPRFAAIRVVSAADIDLQVVAPRGSDARLPTLRIDEAQLALSSKQNLQPGRQMGTQKADGFRTRQWDGIVAQTLAAVEFSNRFKAYENFAVIRYGIFQQEEKPWLAKNAENAITWTTEQAVQVVIDGQKAAALVDTDKVQETYTIDSPGEPKLRIIKVASTQLAEPGEVVEFTLRFDNVGTKVMGNVTIMDNLTTRLEYIPGSAQASVKTDEFERDEQGNLVLDPETKHPRRVQNPVTFSTEINEGDSLVLRWELRDPLHPGQGGIARFKCIVR